MEKTDLVLWVSFHIRGQSGFCDIVFRILLPLVRTVRTSEDVFLRQMASKVSTRASANMPDALQKRGSRNSALNALLYWIRRAL